MTLEILNYLDGKTTVFNIEIDCIQFIPNMFDLKVKTHIIQNKVELKWLN